MNTRTDLPPVALIAGPTASGKSALALALAERTGGIVINADASQLWRDLRVLTARPSPQEEARAPHRLFGTRDAAEPASAALWAGEAAAAVDAAHAAGRLPILVGGSGLYVRTLLAGIAPVPPIDPAIRAAVRTLPVADAHVALAKADPAAAARLGAADTTRVARALEVVRATGHTLAEWQRERHGGIGARVTVHGVVLMPPRALLHARIEARVAAMLAGGAIAEVRALLARALDPALPAMRTIGVAEIADWLAERITREALAARLAVATRRYAKRQTTWLRHQADPDWTIRPDAIDNRNTTEIAIMLHHQMLTR